MSRSRTASIATAGMLVLGCWSEGMPLENTGKADGICGESSCSDTVTVDVTRRDEQIYPPGDYHFSAEIDALFPLIAACTLPPDGPLICSGSAEVHVRLSSSHDRFIVQIYNRAPEQVLLSVWFDDTEIGAEILTPSYEYVGGNDPDCSLTCMQGTAALRTAAP